MVPLALIPPVQALHSDQRPRGFHQILRTPAPLAGCEFPFGFSEWDTLHADGFSQVVCLSSEMPRYDPWPLELRIACELDDLSVLATPDDEERERMMITWIAGVVIEALGAGEGVLVHCAGGRGRTGCVLGVVLRRLGFPAAEVLAYLDEIHCLRGRDGWPESPWQARLIESIDVG